MVGRGQIDANTARTHGQKKHAAFGIFGKCFQGHFSFLQRHSAIQHACLNVRRGQCDLDSMQRFFKRGKNQGFVGLVVFVNVLYFFDHALNFTVGQYFFHIDFLVLVLILVRHNVFERGTVQFALADGALVVGLRRIHVIANAILAKQMSAMRSLRR